VGRVIRSKTDYGIVILADSRYNKTDKRSKFPPWILQFVKDTCLNLSTDVAIDQIKQFLKKMGQPIEQLSLHSILLSHKQVIELQKNSNYVLNLNKSIALDMERNKAIISNYNTTTTGQGDFLFYFVSHNNFII
jgi:hypothetical protein